MHHAMWFFGPVQPLKLQEDDSDTVNAPRSCLIRQQATPAQAGARRLNQTPRVSKPANVERSWAIRRRRGPRAPKCAVRIFGPCDWTGRVLVSLLRP